MATEKSRAFEEKKRQHVEEIAERFRAEFAVDPVKALKPWTEFERPVNALTGKEYRGQNVFTLNWAKSSGGYKRHSWLTFNQAVELGGVVRKGEKSTKIMGSVSGTLGENQADREQKKQQTVDGRDNKLVGFNIFSVFNIEQCDDLRLADVAADGANRSIKSSFGVGDVGFAAKIGNGILAGFDQI